jgi:hypothetical protein
LNCTSPARNKAFIATIMLLGEKRLCDLLRHARRCKKAKKRKWVE